MRLYEILTYDTGWLHFVNNIKTNITNKYKLLLLVYRQKIRDHSEKFVQRRVNIGKINFKLENEDIFQTWVIQDWKQATNCMQII